MSAAKEKTDEHVPLVPRWALIVALVLVVIGVLIGTTREGRERSRAVRMLNETTVRLAARADNKPILDGYAPYYGHVVVMNAQREYDRLLGFCTTKPERALEVFREVLRSGTWQGKALACHMAFYLAQEEALNREDVDAIVGLLSDPNEELRRVAQRELGELLVVRKTDKVKDYEAIGPAPAGVTGRFAAKTGDIEMPVPVKKGEWVRVWWSCPEACQAWWQTFGPKVQWNSAIRRFAIGE